MIIFLRFEFVPLLQSDMVILTTMFFSMNNSEKKM